MSAVKIQVNLEGKIKLEAYYISEKNHSYNDLCWIVAEKLIRNQRKRKGRIAINVVKKKAEEVYKQHNSYDDLCWQIAELTSTSK